MVKSSRTRSSQAKQRQMRYTIHMTFSSRYAALNVAQKQAVDTIDGPVLVVAGPGTGKTELLSMRVANILRKTDTLPESILCLTFTDSGATAMRRRLSSIIGKDAYNVAIHTFHSFGSEIINQYSQFFYKGADMTVADDLVRQQLLEDLLKHLPHDASLRAKGPQGEFIYLYPVLQRISQLKRSGVSPAELTAVLDENEQFFDTYQPAFTQVFAGRISKKTATALYDLFTEHAQDLQKPGPASQAIGGVPLGTLLHNDILRALHAYEESGKTTAITAFKNKWLEKNTAGDFVFKQARQLPNLRELAEVYAGYLAAMQAARHFDFDDMILDVVQALTTNPELRYNLEEQYHYILVDEFQDTNPAQMRILQALTSSPLHEGRPNIMAVGDDDQAIYSFQGADISNILSFESLYPSAQIITLTDNYRSAAPILAHAREVITQNSERLEATHRGINKQLTPHRPEQGAQVALHAYPDEGAEYTAVAERIANLLTKGTSPSDIAVIGRHHKQLKALLPHLAAKQIRVRYERRDNALEQEPIQQLLLLGETLQAIASGNLPAADEYLSQIITHPAWRPLFTPESIWQLARHAYQNKQPWIEAMAGEPIFAPFRTWLLELATASLHAPLELTIDTLLGTPEDLAPASAPKLADFSSPLHHYFFTGTSQPEELAAHIAGLRTIRESAKTYAGNETATLASLLSFARAYRAAGLSLQRVSAAGDVTGVQLLSAHKSKGLEFDHVIIISADNTTWGRAAGGGSKLPLPPNVPIRDNDGTPEEWVRLFFVGMTRAKQDLLITYSQQSLTGKDLNPAAFLTATSLEEQLISSNSQQPSSALQADMQAWYAPIVQLPQPTMREFLQYRLDHFALSATALNTYLDISRGGPANFLLYNLLGFPRRWHAAAEYGTAVHATIKQAHTYFIAHGTPQPLAESLHFFTATLQRSPLRGEELETLLAQGQAELSTFLPHLETTFTPHQKTELSFAHQQCYIGNARLTGTLDAVDIDTKQKTLIITDYKTGKPVTAWKGGKNHNALKLHAYRRQLLFYTLLAGSSRDYHSFTVQQAQLRFIRQTPEGEFATLATQFTEEELARGKALIQAVWQAIFAADFTQPEHAKATLASVIAFEDELIARYPAA